MAKSKSAPVPTPEPEEKTPYEVAHDEIHTNHFLIHGAALHLRLKQLEEKAGLSVPDSIPVPETPDGEKD